VMDEPHLSWSDIVTKSSDPDLADAMLFRSEKLRLSGAPVLYSLKHLSLSCGVDYGFLRGVVRRNLKAYRSLRIPKNTGGFRNLQSPIEALAKAQRWILHEILYKVPRHRNNYAYFPKVTTLDSAKRHAGASWLIKTDIHDYFPSVGEKMVYKVFSDLGYSSLLSFELARLCTWPHNLALAGSDINEVAGQVIPSYVYPASDLGSLPQGAPTSGALSNACTYALDETLSKMAISERLIYSRYSDDMVFSTKQAFDRSYASALILRVKKIVKLSGFEIHDKKTKLVPPGARKIVLGMLIGDCGVGILPEHKRMISVYIHGVFRYGPIAYSERREFDSVISFFNHVEGWLAHLSSIDQQWTKSQSEAWRAALSKHGVVLNALN
jgi:RNA-directed DNA polymerase